MKTHRCSGSLEQKVSIRYDKIYPWSIIDDNQAWNLRKPKYDYDYDRTDLVFCCEITYCPFCGEKLC